MKKYFKYFMIPFIIFGIILIVFTAMMIVKNMPKTYIRNNALCTSEQRVFDYADLLTDEEETRLETLIAITEAECGADIVIVNLNSSLEEFAHNYDPYARVEDYIMIFADEFYESYAFGYDAPYGDGVIFVDNRCHEADGYMYDWISTTGRVEWAYSEDMIDDILWDTEEYLDENAYKAYETFVKRFKKDMQAEDGMTFVFSDVYIVIPGIITLIFCLATRHKKGKKTTTEKTFLGYQQMNDTRDVFIRKSVSSRRIQTSSSSGGGGSRSGGGGHHRSSSGRSHGGGGHRRR